MSSGIWVAASGAVARMTQIEASANNVANANTIGFKVDQPLFQEHLVKALHAGRNVEQMRLVRIGDVRPHLGNGPIKVTNRPLDLAIQGDGFFAVQAPSGERYTRLGSLELGADGRLSTPDGLPLLNQQRRPIVVPAGAKDVTIDSEGNVLADGQTIAQLRLVSFADKSGLEKEGQLLFRSTERSGQARIDNIRLEPGALELANLSIVSGLTEIVSASRAFDALERVIEAFRDADQRAATDLMRK